MVVARLLAAGLCAAALAPGVAAQPLPSTLEDRVLVTSFGDVAALAVGRDVLYVAGSAGIAVRDLLRERWLPPLAPVPGYPQDGMASALAYDPVADGLWLGTATGELYQLSFAFGEWRRASFVADEIIIRIVPDPARGVLWVGTPSGWYRVDDDGSSGRFMIRAEMIPREVRESGERNIGLLAMEGTLGLDPGLQRFPLTDAVPGDRDNVFFVGTAGGGVVRVDTNTGERAWLQFGTLSRGAGAVEVIGDEIWFGGDGQGPHDGVTRASRDLSTWVQLEAGVEDAPRGFVARIAGGAAGVWFATSEGAWHLAAGTDGEWTRLTSGNGLPADQTTSVAPAVDGVWIGTLRGLARVDATGQVTGTQLEGARVLDLAMAGDTLWIAADRGMFTLVGEGAPEPVTEPALANRPVVAVAAGGATIAALTPDALHVRRAGAWLPPERTLQGLGTLLRLRLGPQGEVWVAGENGVAVVAPDRAPRLWRVPGDIPAGPVRGLAVDGDRLWVATPGGALRLDPSR